MKKKMNSSYGRERGDLSGATYSGRVDIYDRRTTEWLRVVWTGDTATGDARNLAIEVATEVGGLVVEEFFQPQANSGRGYFKKADYASQIVVV